LLRLRVPAVRREDQESADEERARGTDEAPRLEVAREHVPRQGRCEVETKRGDDDEKTDRHRRPHAEDGTGTFQIHRLIRRMMASSTSSNCSCSMPRRFIACRICLGFARPPGIIASHATDGWESDKVSALAAPTVIRLNSSRLMELPCASRSCSRTDVSRSAV